MKFSALSAGRSDLLLATGDLGRICCSTQIPHLFSDSKVAETGIDVSS